MIVYLLIGEVQDDPSLIVGVYSTEEKAQAEKERLQRHREVSHGR
jgi:hypothetical protein